ncbi:MAG: mitochondrial fission ELM1 family protein [Sedimenticola sp.]|nr:mitochondrial fission ELM1 family protein [Sedimenticola sp.]
MKPAPDNQKDRSDKPLVIWRLIDGKPGHENQSLGLCNALARIIDVERVDIPVGGRFRQFLDWLAGCFPRGEKQPPPDLIMGAGHRTHLALLAARRAFGGRAVVIMKPSLPRRLFDLCVAPEHDGVTGKNVFLTRGVMNTISPRGCDAPDAKLSAEKGPGGEAAPSGMEREDTASETHSASQTLILLGGNSSHCGWHDDAVLEQLEMVVREQPGERFVLGDSRRTPAGFMPKIAVLQLPNLLLVPWQQTGPGWVAEQLARSHVAWVSEDSVSMVYEAITSGAAVGLIGLERKGEGRVSRGLERLILEGSVTPFRQWRESGVLSRAPGVFDEATRCATWMVEEWL